MRQISRALARWEMLRVAAAGAAIAGVILLGSFIVAAVTVRPDPGGVVAAIAALAIGAAAILYAWREPGP